MYPYLGWSHDNYQPSTNYGQQYGEVVNDWNAYQQSLYNQGYYWPQPATQHNSYYHHQQPATTHHSGVHKGKQNCKHKFNHVEEKKKEVEVTTTTTTTETPTTTTTEKPTTITSTTRKTTETPTTTMKTTETPTTESPTTTTTHTMKTTTTRKPPIIQIDFRWPPKKNSSHVTDKLHSHELDLTNVFNETIDKVADQVDRAFAAIKQLVDKSVEQIDDKTSHVHQQSYNLVDEFTNKLKKIERHLAKLKFKGADKRIDVEGEFDNDEDSTRETDDTVKSAFDESKVTVISKDKESRRMRFENNELRYDIKSSISDAMQSTHDRFDKLVDEKFEKINKKIADVGGKWDAALDKFYSTVEKLKFTGSSSTSKPLIDESTKVIDWKPKHTTPLPVFSNDYFTKSTTPEYFKYTIPSIKYRKEESLDDIDSLMPDFVGQLDDENPKISNPAESAIADELIESEVEQEGKGKSEIVDESSKSVDDLQTEIVQNVKDSLKMADDDVPARSLEFDDVNISSTIIPSNIDERFDEDEGKPSI